MLLKCSKVCGQNPWRATVSNFKDSFIIHCYFSEIFILHMYTYIFHKQPVCKQPVLTR